MTRNILPKAAKEEDRLLIQQQLKLKNKVDPEELLDAYQEEKRRNFVNKCAQMYNMNPD